MKRSKPLQRRTPLKAKAPMRKVSKKQAEINMIYSKLGPEFLHLHDVCEFPGCNAPSEQIHHKLKRGINTLNVESLCALCAEHHAFVESHKNWARENGLMD